MAKLYKRGIRAVLHRRVGNSTIEIFVRYFSKLSSAMSRGVTMAIFEGQPGDVLEVSSSNFGYLIATLKMKVGSKNLATMEIKFHMADALEAERRTALELP